MFYVLWRNKLCGNWDVYHRAEVRSWGTFSMAQEVAKDFNGKHYVRIVFSEEEL